MSNIYFNYFILGSLATLFLIILRSAYIEISVAKCTNTQLKKPNTNIGFLFVFFILIALSTLITEQYSPDYYNYKRWFDAIDKYSIDRYTSYIKDPAFFVLSKLIHLVSHEFIVLHVLYITIVFSVLYKILNHNLFSGYASFALLVLFSMFYIIHEVIQIRIAVAIALGMLSFLYLYDNKRMLFGLFFLLSIAFHLAGIFLLVPIIFYFLAINKCVTYLTVIVLLSISVALYFLEIDYRVMVNYLPDLFLKRSQKYLLGSYPIKPVKIFTTYNLVKLSMILVFLAFYHNMDRIGRTTALTAAFNFVVFLIFKNNDSISLRYTQYFSLFDVLFYVSVIRSFSIYEPYYKKIRLFAFAVFSVGGLIWLRATMRIILGDFI